MIDSQDVEAAWDRIARTADGILIYRHLQRIRLGLAPANAPDSALPRLEGRRSLAADLMAFMSEGIAENDRASVTFAFAEPVAYDKSRRPGAGRRVSTDTFVAGYDDDTPTTNGGPGTKAGPGSE